ncbi:signal peptidase II [Egibacter rhizosphaerae]|uniref:signal peptidase II n=1 Tax=Egibacter rhizosphaerae TaxID=1670831 RepID=UPI0013F14590|nr:signal peptidase II [Egibacter rhizosphaerae]
MWVVAIAVTGIWLLLDQATKVLAVWYLSDGPIELGGEFSLVLVRNPNAAFGIPGFPGMFLLVTVVVLAIIARLLTRTDRLSLALAYGLVAGGAAGNALDRLARDPDFPPQPAPGMPGRLEGAEILEFLSAYVPEGAVVDFLSVGWWPVFNVADVGITVGAACIVVLMILVDREEQRAEAERAGHDSVRPETTTPRR